MTKNDDTRHDDETKRGASSYALFETLLEAIDQALDEMSSSPRTRELRAKADSYAHTIQRWRSGSPTPAQREAMRDLIVALHEEIAATRTTPR